jgi:membrane-associated phospholipid phosphatase
MTYVSRAFSPRSTNSIPSRYLKTALIWFPFVACAVMFSKYYIDDWTALHFMEVLKASKHLNKGTSDIPDLLTIDVIVICSFFWGRYAVLWWRRAPNEQMQSCRVAGTAVPLAYFLKWPFKFAFGRLNTRIWLASHVNDQFHWFQRGKHYDSFPSGHMLVFAALFTALWLFYPRYRPISAGLALILAASLVATGYHFVSDVIAGTYLGLLITILTAFCFEIICNREDLQ